MKKIATLIIALFSISTFAGEFDPNYNENCAKRYIRGSQDLVLIAEAFNGGDIGKAEYAARVASVDTNIMALRAYCMNENSDAQECVSKTKIGFTKIREKMNVREVLRSEQSRVEVSQVDLLKLVKGSVGGFFRSLRNGNQNICTLDASFE